MAIDTDPGLKGQSIYQVFIRNYSPEGSFDAALPALERAKRFGFDIVYLVPIHPIGKAARKGSVGSPYAIADYRAVDPALGGEAGFRRFVDRAHDLGLKLIIDVVYNHTSPDSVLVREHPEWFWKDAKGRPAPRVADWSDVVDLDYRQRGLWDYQIETLEAWIRFGVDGFRCDVASLVPVPFWGEARRRVQAVMDQLGRGRAIWLAESVHPDFVLSLREAGHYAACDAELHEAFDLSYDYDGRDALEDAWAGRSGLGPYLHHLGLQRSMYPAHALKARFLENHDQPRAASRFRGARLRNWTLFTMLLDGTFLAYAGEEAAIARKPDLFEHDPVDWTAADSGFEAWFGAAHRVTKAAREREPRFEAKEIAAGVVFIERSGGNQPLRALLNLDGRSGFVDLPSAIAGKDPFTGEEIMLEGRLALGEQPVISVTKP